MQAPQAVVSWTVDVYYDKAPDETSTVMSTKGLDTVNDAASQLVVS